MAAATSGWEFFIDRGGTFTDVVARRPDRRLVTYKLLSEDPTQYADAALEGIRRALQLAPGEPIPTAQIAAVRMGTTVATNALLERRGASTLLVITRGFGDALRIAYQHRPQLFARHIVLPEMLYRAVLEVDERIDAHGEELIALQEPQVQAELKRHYDAGLRAVAIVFMHGYRYPQHEARVAAIARAVGFTQVSVSHEVSPLIKLVGRGDTTVIDAYLSPLLRQYVETVARALKDVPLYFMQSNGGMTVAAQFQGKDAILSGPAGGVVGAVRVATAAGFSRVIGFDMGGTSTDVMHYAGNYEHTFDTVVAGVRVRAPMLQIHTVAAGGGSLLRFDGARYRVGPQSAGANPGPACYRRDGPLTITDANVMLGKIQPKFFPAMFGSDANLPLANDVVVANFEELAARIAQTTGDRRSPEAVAEGFVQIAVMNMANAIKRISIQRGYDVTQYVLCSFGGAAGQHVCLVADLLGINSILVHPFAGVLSAFGMGLAAQTVVRELSFERPLDDAHEAALLKAVNALENEAGDRLLAQGIGDAALTVETKLLLKVAGSDTTLSIPFAPGDTLRASFAEKHLAHFGFAVSDKPIIVDTIVVQASALQAEDELALGESPHAELTQAAEARFYSGGKWHTAPLFIRTALPHQALIGGPALIVEAGATTVVEPGWRAEVTSSLNLLMTRVHPKSSPEPTAESGAQVDPVRLEIFNNVFMSIAEQMGARLQQTAHSVNIKERLDFSCALFDRDANLIANAPHIPVHLGSMGESVRVVHEMHATRTKAGDVYVLNAPYNGGTHLPDVTVITPVFDAAGAELLFYVGSRGHHADIGGITPGSMPPHSRNIDEEGVQLDNAKLVDGGIFQSAAIETLLASGRWPARNIEQNLADLRAQIAANEKGAQELRALVAHHGHATVQAYMRHVQDNATVCVRTALRRLQDGAFAVTLDSGATIRVQVTLAPDKSQAHIDFTGTSPQQPDNFNAPAAVTTAAVLYVFRCLIDDDIPLNAGCLKPLTVNIPEGCLLRPCTPAAVVAGNVETSQCITDALFGALGALAGSQGTMNNFTFGNARYQYYETLAGGAGAGPGFDGASAVQVHMTNSRLTDPEVLETRFPVLLEEFAIRRGSGGGGRNRGGDGVVRRIRFLEAMTASILSNRRQYPPHGLAGGAPGLAGRNYVVRADGAHHALGATAQVAMQPGDIFIIETPGGGGYGA